MIEERKATEARLRFTGGAVPDGRARALLALILGLQAPARINVNRCPAVSEQPVWRDGVRVDGAEDFATPRPVEIGFRGRQLHWEMPDLFTTFYDAVETQVAE